MVVRISETTTATWNCLHETYMPMPDKNGTIQSISRAIEYSKLHWSYCWENIYAYKAANQLPEA
jgi:hypothetical protein